MPDIAIRVQNPSKLYHVLLIVRLLIVLLVLLWWAQTAMWAAAQTGSLNWAEPVNLSDTPQASLHPAIVSDAYGYVHVLWTEDVDGEKMEDLEGSPTGNSIVYRRWDGTTWSPITDVLAAPGEAIAGFVAAAIDTENQLHAVWIGQSNLYYSNVSAWQADVANAWSKPLVLATNCMHAFWAASIAADGFDGLHVVYAATDAEGVYYIRSMDGGRSWRMAASPLSVGAEWPEDSFSTVKVITDRLSRIHAVWQTNTVEGYGQAVYYARSPDGGENWTPAVQMGYRDPGDFAVDFPYLTAVGASELHLIYSDSPRPVRFERTSADGGETWSEPYPILTDMQGTTGYTVPIVDGGGQVHLIIDMRTKAGQINGIYYAHWLDSAWSDVTSVDVASPGAPNAHHVAATVRLGNELHIIWGDPAAGEIWYTQGSLPEADQIPPLGLPLPNVSTRAMPEVREAITRTPALSVVAGATRLMATPMSPTLQPGFETSGPDSLYRTTGASLALSAGLALLVVTGGVLFARVRSASQR